MTDKSDQEKIAAAAVVHDSGAGIYQTSYYCFKAGIAWRDKNPGPHVMALVAIVRKVKSEYGHVCHCEVDVGITCDGCYASEALAQFEKATAK
jgi:hypothetical protein